MKKNLFYCCRFLTLAALLLHFVSIPARAGTSVFKNYSPSMPVGRSAENRVYDSELNPLDLLTHKIAELRINRFLFQSPESGNTVIKADIPAFSEEQEPGSDEPYDGGFISDIDDEYPEPGLLADDEFSKLLPVTVCIPDSDEPEQLDIHESEVSQYFNPPEIRVRYVRHLEGADVHSREYHIYMAGEASGFNDKDDEDPDWETTELVCSRYESDDPVSGVELDTVYQGDASSMMTTCNSTFTYYDEAGNRYQAEIQPPCTEETLELIDRSSCTLCKELSMGLVSYCGKHSQCSKCLKGHEAGAGKAQHQSCPVCNMPSESVEPAGGFKHSIKDYPELNQVFSQLYVKCPFGDGCSKVICCTELMQHSWQDHGELCDICNTSVFRPVFAIHCQWHVDGYETDPEQACKMLMKMLISQGNELRQCQTELRQCQTELVSCQRELETRQEQVEACKADIQQIARSFNRRLLILEAPPLELPHEVDFVLKDYKVTKERAELGYPNFISQCSPVYAIPNGYHFQLRVYLDGDGIGKKSHLSAFFCLVKGENDDMLKWPFSLRVQITLSGMGRHKDVSEIFKPDRKSSSFQKPQTKRNTATGRPTFVSHNDVKKYIFGDKLYFKCIILPE